MARPTNINQNIIKAVSKVANDEINSIILTDEELVLEANDLLGKDDKFSYSAFRDWKAFALGTKKREDTTEENYKLYEKLGAVIKKALLLQKKNLFNQLSGDDKAWQRFAWIIERKFDDWNIRHKTDFEGKLIGEIKTTKYVPGKKK